MRALKKRLGPAELFGKNHHRTLILFRALRAAGDREKNFQRIARAHPAHQAFAHVNVFAVEKQADETAQPARVVIELLLQSRIIEHQAVQGLSNRACLHAHARGSSGAASNRRRYQYLDHGLSPPNRWSRALIFKLLTESAGLCSFDLPRMIV